MWNLNKKKLKFKKKEANNLEQEATFSLQGKLSNFDEEVELNEHTPFYFILSFKCCS